MVREDQSRVFHLVIDELHTYRGTPGSEVAYLIRLLLRRLGLRPDSPQVRFMASSASLDAKGKGAEYLRGFFGIDAVDLCNYRGRDEKSCSVALGCTPGPLSRVRRFRSELGVRHEGCGLGARQASRGLMPG